MTVIDYLTQRGFSARVAGHRLVISPASRLTDDVRKYVKAHRLELIAELAANDGQQRAWLERVAALLNTTADGLLARELIDANDMAEQYRTDPRHAAKLIASTPNWLALEQVRGQFCAQYAYARKPVSGNRPNTPDNSAWTTARNALHRHALGFCPVCYPPHQRYCESGAELNACYVHETTILEACNEDRE